MGYTIALAGKGGTGKTTIAAFLVNYLRSRAKGSVLAIDADPNTTLGQALAGVDPNTTVVDILDNVAALRGALPAGMSKNRYIEYETQLSLAEGEGYDLLAMGRPEGPGCYCYANTVLRGVIEKFQKHYHYVVIDNEAGMEHLSRRTTRTVDMLLVVSDFSAVGVRSAKRISDLAHEMKLTIAHTHLLLNMATGSADRLADEIRTTGLALMGVVSFDEELQRLSLLGKPVVASDRKSRSEEEFDRIIARYVHV